MVFNSNIVSPEQRVKARKNVFDEYINIAQPAAASQQGYEKQKLKRDVMGQTAQNIGQSIPATQVGALQTQMAGAQGGVNLLGQQAQQQQALNVQGAQMQQQIAAAKNQQAVMNVKRGLDKDIDTYTRVVADRAFQEGLQAKQLIFHMNSQLADYAMDKLKQDFEAGRVSKAELEQLLLAQKKRLAEKKAEADKAMAEYVGKFRTDLAQGNAKKAKARLDAAIQAQKDMGKDAIRAGNIASIITGATEIGSAVVQKYTTKE